VCPPAQCGQPSLRLGSVLHHVQNGDAQPGALAGALLGHVDHGLIGSHRGLDLRRDGVSRFAGRRPALEKAAMQILGQAHTQAVGMRIAEKCTLDDGHVDLGRALPERSRSASRGARPSGVLMSTTVTGKRLSEDAATSLPDTLDELHALVTAGPVMQGDGQWAVRTDGCGAGGHKDDQGDGDMGVASSRTHSYLPSLDLSRAGWRTHERGKAEARSSGPTDAQARACSTWTGRAEHECLESPGFPVQTAKAAGPKAVSGVKESDTWQASFGAETKFPLAIRGT